MILALRTTWLPASFAVLLLTLAACSGGLPAQLMPDKESARDAVARVDYYENAAKQYYEGGNYQQSVAMWDKFLAERPTDQWAKFGLAKSLQMIGTVPSLRRAEAIIVGSDGQPGLLTLEWIHPTRGDIKFEVKSTLAIVYSQLADFYDRDIREIDAKLAKDPSADTQSLQEWLTRQKRMRDNLLHKSAPLWRDVLEASPDNPYALAGLSKAYLLTNNEQAGIHYADRYIDLSRKSQQQWRDRLREWEQLRRGEVSPEQRAFYLEKIHGARQKEIGMLMLLGSVHMRREEFLRAVDRYDAVLALDPAHVAALVERAQAYAALSRYDQAVKDLEQYLKLTDARKQREARINAAELLDRYRQILARQALNSPGPASSTRAPSGQPSGSR